MIIESECRDLEVTSEVIDIVKDAFASDDTDMVPKVYLDCDEGDFRAMPARIGNVAGVKWVSVFPDNAKLGLPTVMGVIILNDADTGELICVMDGTAVTKMRTAAAAAIATDLLARKDSEVAAFIGCGGQTESHIKYIRSVRPNIKKVFLYDCDIKKAKELSERVDDSFAVSDAECVVEADIITTLTPSRDPVIMGNWIKSGTHINAMGADAEGKREFDDKTYDKVDLWVVDDVLQAIHSGETQHLYFDMNITSLSETEGRLYDNQTTLFDSTGLAIQDIAVAKYLYEKQRRLNDA